MSSKYIKNSRIKNTIGSLPPTNNETQWFSFGITQKDREEDALIKKESKKLKAEKQRIESIPLEDLSFKDLYKFPFHQAKYGNWVYDVDSNFIFQFQFNGKETQEKLIKILNGEIEDYKRQNVTSESGLISIDEKPFILIRGWGSLTGIGGYNLDGEYAAKIQDTLEEYIVEKLSKL